MTPGGPFPAGAVHWIAMAPPFGAKELRWMRTGDLTMEARKDGLQLTCSTRAARCLEREHFAQGSTVRSSRMLLPWTRGDADQERTTALWLALLDEVRNGADLVDLKP